MKRYVKSSRSQVGMLDAIIDCYGTGFTKLTIPIYDTLCIKRYSSEDVVEKALKSADPSTISELYYTLRQIVIDEGYYEVMNDFNID